MLLTTPHSSLSLFPLPLRASSQSAETPCVSAKQWSIPSVYFTYFCCSSCCLSLSSLFSCFLLCVFHSYCFILSLLSMFFIVKGGVEEHLRSKDNLKSTACSEMETYPHTVIRTSGEGCGRLQEIERIESLCVCLSPTLLRKNIEKLLFTTIIDLLLF